MAPHFTSTQLRGAGFKPVQLKVNGYNPKQLFSAGYILSDIKETGFTLDEFKDSGVSVSNIKNAGFTGKSLKLAGYSAFVLKTLGYSLRELAKTTIAKKFNIRYNVKNLNLSDLTTNDGVALVNIKIRIRDRYAAKYNLPINRIQVNIYDANSIDVDVEVTTTTTQEETAVTNDTETDTEDIITEETGIATDPNTTTTTTTITNEEFIGYSATELKEAGYGIIELYQAGFIKPELFVAGFEISDFRKINTSKAQLLALGFTEEEIRLAGIEFYLEAFSTTVQMDVLADIIEGKNINELTGFDATGILYLSKTLMNEVFTVKLVGDLNDLENVNITYFTNIHKWTEGLVINSANTVMDHERSNGAIYSFGTREKMLLKHDFVRYIAYKMFGTVQAVDLFNNEDQMIRSLNTLGNNNFQQDISGILWQYASTNPNPETSSNYVFDPSLNMYGTTETFVSSDNVCRELFQQLIKARREK